MTDNLPQGTPPSGVSSYFEPGVRNIQLIYVLYLVSLVFGITGLVAIILAYINRGKSEAWIETHYSWAIRTFWIGMLYAFISAMLFLFGIGVLLMFATGIWFVIRCVIGLQASGRREPIKNPDSWIL